MADAQPRSGRPRGSFATTQWSLVVAAGETDSPQARAALEALCRDYWQPIYVYLRRRGSDRDRAADETQGFFVKLIEKNYVGDARPERGRFRTFLLTSLKHYLANERDRDTARKRGGGRAPVPIDTEEGEAAHALEAARNERPDRAFERRWARSVLEVTLDRLRDEAKTAGTHERLEAFLPFLAGGAGRPYRQVADRLEMTESAARVAVHRTRLRFRAILRDEVARIVDDPDQVDEELRFLVSVLGT